MEYVASVSVSLLAPAEDCEELVLGIDRELRWLQDDTLLGFVWGVPGGWSNPDFSIAVEANDGYLARELATEYLSRAMRNANLGIHSGLFGHTLPGEPWMFEASEQVAA